MDSHEERFCLADPVKLQSPFADYPYFREHKPIYWHEPLQSWFVFRYDDVDRLFHDQRLSNKRLEGWLESTPPRVRERFRKIGDRYFSRWLLNLDEPDHKALRKLLQPRLNEHAVEELTPFIQQTIDELLDGLKDRTDLAADFAYRLPVIVIAHILGVPREDYARFIAWSDAVASYFNSLPPTDEQAEALLDSVDEMLAYFKDPFPELEHDTAMANAILLLVAGHETTRNLIGSAVHLLLTHPKELAGLQADRSLMRAAIDETLRLEPPNPIMARIAAVDFEPFKKGQMVFLGIGSANRDPEHFPDPEIFRLDRPVTKLLSFGSGPHFCIGAILARQETSLALNALLTGFPNMRLDPDRPPAFIHQAGMRGPSSLPICF